MGPTGVSPMTVTIRNMCAGLSSGYESWQCACFYHPSQDHTGWWFLGPCGHKPAPSVIYLIHRVWLRWATLNYFTIFSNITCIRQSAWYRLLKRDRSRSGIWDWPRSLIVCDTRNKGVFPQGPNRMSLVAGHFIKWLVRGKCDCYMTRFESE